MVPWQTGGAPSIWSRSPNLHVRIALPTKENPGRHWYLIISPVNERTGRGGFRWVTRWKLTDVSKAIQTPVNF